MEKEYYLLCYRLNQKDGYLIWYSDETDGLLTDESGKVISFNSKQQLLEFAFNINITIQPDEPEFHNMDLVNEWIKENDPMLINFSAFNGIWNLWTDIANSTGRSFYQDKVSTDEIYDKLFWSCELPTANPEDRRYYPEWTERELITMKELFSGGMAMFQETLVTY